METNPASRATGSGLEIIQSSNAVPGRLTSVIPAALGPRGIYGDGTQCVVYMPHNRYVARLHLIGMYQSTI